MPAGHVRGTTSGARRFLVGLCALALVGLLAGCPPAPPTGDVSVEVRLTFGDTGHPDRPVAHTPVELWSNDAFGIWAKQASGVMDPQGHFTATTPFVNAHTKYAVRVLTQNAWAHCCKGWSPTGVLAAWVEPGQDRHNRRPIQPSASGPGPLVIEYAFRGAVASMFNALDAMFVAGSFAQANRGVGDANTLDPAEIGLAGNGANDVSWFDPVMYSVNLTPSDRWNDGTVLHEYGHFLQAQLSNFAWMPSAHNGCTPSEIIVIGNPTTKWKPGSAALSDVRAMHAWMEGFADWFAAAAYASSPGSIDEPPTDLEKAACPASQLQPPDYGDVLELHVAAYLWDLTDVSSGEPLDQIGGSYNTRMVIEVFDIELDAGGWPTVLGFTVALTQHPGVDTTGMDLVAGLNFVTWPYN